MCYTKINRTLDGNLYIYRRYPTIVIETTIQVEDGQIDISRLGESIVSDHMIEHFEHHGIDVIHEQETDDATDRSVFRQFLTFIGIGD